MNQPTQRPTSPRGKRKWLCSHDAGVGIFEGFCGGLEVDTGSFSVAAQLTSPFSDWLVA
jgi:hypothetical protein